MSGPQDGNGAEDYTSRRAADAMAQANDTPAPVTPVEPPTVSGPVQDAPTLQQVAWKGAVQTFLIGMVVDVVLAIAFVVLAGLDKVTTVEGLIALLIAVAKSAVMGVFRYLVRTLIDRSGYDRDGNPKPISKETPN